jgi:hypothetical protein
MNPLDSIPFPAFFARVLRGEEDFTGEGNLGRNGPDCTKETR